MWESLVAAHVAPSRMDSFEDLTARLLRKDGYSSVQGYASI